MGRQAVLIKVYGQVRPMPPEALTALQAGIGPMLGDSLTEEALELDGVTLLLNYEGVFFPLEEALELLRPYLNRESSGQINYLDLEAWTVEKIVITGGRLESSRRGLNNILEYAGK